MLNIKNQVGILSVFYWNAYLGILQNIRFLFAQFLYFILDSRHLLTMQLLDAQM